MHPEAEALNATIGQYSPQTFSLLSQKGKAMLFPQKGIMQQTLAAKGTKINATIGIGFDDQGIPLRLEYIENSVTLPPKEVFPYAPSGGLPKLRELWRDAIAKHNPSIQGETSLPIVASGLTHALWMAASLFVDPGDTVLLPEYHWENYDLMLAQGIGAEIRTYPMFSGSRFDLKGFANTIGAQKGKTIVVLNFPNNPTGYTVTADEALAIRDILKTHAHAGNPTVAIVDDAYFGFVYTDDAFKESLFALLADADPNLLAVKIDGASKEYFAWGLRVGFITLGIAGGVSSLYNALESKIAGLARMSISNVSMLSQSLIVHAMESPDYHRGWQTGYDLLKRRYEAAMQAIGEHSNASLFQALPCNSSYFLCLRLRDGLDADALRRTLASDHGVGVIALGNVLRVAFSSVATRDIPALFAAIATECKDAVPSI